MDHRTQKTDITHTLSADQAADILSKSPRHVRRLIARGVLEGTRDPYRTTRAAVDAYRFRQRTKDADMGGPQVHERSPEGDHGDGLMDMLVQSVERLARENGRLQSEVGRLEAELAQCRRQASERRTSNVERRGGAQRGGVLRRVGLWLRRPT